MLYSVNLASIIKDGREIAEYQHHIFHHSLDFYILLQDNPEVIPPGLLIRFGYQKNTLLCKQSPSHVLQKNSVCH